MDKSIIGFIIIYGFVLTILPYFLYHHINFTRFITYVANVDLIANVLATCFPNYFKNVYDIKTNSFPTYLSYNIITLYALSGIFLYGLNLKFIGHSNSETFKSMIAVSIITFTLPTLLIPYLTHYVNKLSKYIALNYIKRENKSKDITINKLRITDHIIDNINIIVSIVIATLFIVIECYFIENFIFVKTISYLKKKQLF